MVASVYFLCYKRFQNIPNTFSPFAWKAFSMSDDLDIIDPESVEIIDGEIVIVSAGNLTKATPTSFIDEVRRDPKSALDNRISRIKILNSKLKKTKNPAHRTRMLHEIQNLQEEESKIRKFIKEKRK